MEKPTTTTTTSFNGGNNDSTLPPPFGSKPPESNNNKNKIPTNANFPKVPIGSSDKEPAGLGGQVDSEGTGGMIMGPGHPVFENPIELGPPPINLLPPGAVPPGAHFDPITPIGPSRGEHGRILYPSGEPDPDELYPPGLLNNPLDPGWRLPRSRQFPPENSRPGNFNPFGGGGGPHGFP